MTAPVLAFLAGLLMGSFLNVCIYRLPRDLSIIHPRSFCPHCEHMIPWYDNVPLFSYLLLRGRCRFCQHRIAMRYPAVELATGAAFWVFVSALGPTLPAAKWCLFSALLIALTVMDFEERILPDELTLGGMAAGLIAAVFVPVPAETISLLVAPRFASITEAAFGAVIAGGSIWFVGWAYKKIRHREGMGFGDVKMIAMIGAFLGAPYALLAVTAGSLVGAIAGIAYISIARKDASTYELPFGSFLGIAALGVAVFVEALGAC